MTPLYNLNGIEQRYF